MSAAHTPWTAHKTTADWWAVNLGEGEFDPTVAAVWCTFGEAEVEATARLIAAAPDLLEALREAQQNWHHMIGLSSPAEFHRLNERMSAAIRKATTAVEPNSVGTPQGVSPK